MTAAPELCVYRIHSNDGDPSYVGQTNQPRRRWMVHKAACASGNKHPLYEGMREIGSHLFRMDVLCVGLTQVGANETERSLMAHYLLNGSLYNKIPAWFLKHKISPPPSVPAPISSSAWLGGLPKTGRKPPLAAMWEIIKRTAE